MTDYRWAVFQANLNPAVGSEQRGTRPVLIVSNEDHNQTIPNVTVLPLTSTRRGLYYAEVTIPARKAGQPLESIIMAHQIRTISKLRLGTLIGYLDDAKLQNEVRQAIKDHLDLE